VSKAILSDLEKYFTNKLSQFGPSPAGVDWKNDESQKLRFKQFFHLLESENHLKLNDVGCGYGALYGLLSKKNKLKLFYRGYDISQAMVNAASKKYGGNKNFKVFKINKLEEIRNADYTVASGIFNNKFHHSSRSWLLYILKSLITLNEKSHKGFGFNALTSYSDKSHRRKDLYYANPSFLFDYCKGKFSKNVSLFHDYGLYEFTILVKKEKRGGN